ncbi:MAG: ABC transporter ATP-binding protein [Gammaproteobacteria bacterium]|nr:ABC transporter ATP-binding protein [Gammaproteobacteria bacterium]
MTSILKPPTLVIQNARLSYDKSILFNNLSLTLAGGKWTCLLGPSGVGKSSLLRLIANLSSGSTQISAEITTDTNQPLSELIAYMAQTDLLLPWLNVLENVLLGSRLRGESPAPKEKALALLAEVGLEKALERLPADLSGGMRQRVALVRTLIQDKPIVLMDEPFSALDAITRFKLQNLASHLLRNKTVLLVTHDPLEALRLADDIFIMSGLPATLHSPISLQSPAPRDPASAEVIALQATLFHELTKAHEASL